MSLVISDVYFSGFERIFSCKETNYVKPVTFTNDEWLRYRSSSFFFEWIVTTIKGRLMQISKSLGTF